MPKHHVVLSNQDSDKAATKYDSKTSKSNTKDTKKRSDEKKESALRKHKAEQKSKTEKKVLIFKLRSVENRVAKILYFRKKNPPKQELRTVKPTLQCLLAKTLSKLLTLK
jgi:hypothetical protein